MYDAVIVDDESFVVEGIRTAIDWSGFNFDLQLCTTDPFQALEYCENHPVDLVITDIAMPQMDGIELIRRIREASPLTSILVLSAYDNFDFVRSAMLHGAENYLLKPLDPDELMESVSRIAGHLQKRRELSETYGSAMLTFRSSFIENWVKGSLSEEEFLTRAQMLGVNLYLSDYTVVILSVPSTRSQGKERMSVLFDYLLSLIVGKYISHFYFESPTTLVCIISSAGPESPLGNLLDQLMEARKKLKFPFFTSAGITVDNYADVNVSYRSASRFLFLQYSALPGIVANDMDLTAATVSVIEQDYAELDKEHYLEQLHHLFWSLPRSRQASFVLGVLNWGVSQACPDNDLDESLIDLLGKLPSFQEKGEDILAYLDTFVDTCCRVYEKRQAARTATYPWVDTVIRAVHDFSDKEISLKTLAARLNLHPSYLGSIFRQQTGYYFSDYLNEERLKYAAGLIRDTDLKLKDIVDMAGFSSQTYFNRRFRRKYGVSPNEYRREIRSKVL